MPRVIVFTAAPWVVAEQVAAVAAIAGVGPEHVAVATSSGRLAREDLPKATFDSAVAVGPSGHHSVQVLATMSSTLSPGGRLIVQEENEDNTVLKKNLVLCGFEDVKAMPEAGSTSLAARKPSWETGTKAAINLKSKAGTDAGNGNGVSSIWKLDADDECEDDLIDEDDLLTEEDLGRPEPQAQGSGDDCDIGKGGRKACVNCTCGRAEGGKPKKLTKEMLDNPQPAGGCGSCALGDAFRCGTCPYRGLPAFEPGKRIEVPADFLIADME